MRAKTAAVSVLLLVIMLSIGSARTVADGNFRQYTDTILVNSTLDSCDQYPPGYYGEIIPFTIGGTNPVPLRLTAVLPGTADPVTGLVYAGAPYGFSSPYAQETLPPYIITLNAQQSGSYDARVYSSTAGAYSLTIEGVNLSVGEPWDCDTATLYNASVTFELELQGRPAPPHPRWSVPIYIEYTSRTDHWTSQFTTDENGTFTWSPLPSGTVSVVVDSPGALSIIRTNVTIVPGQNIVDLGTLRMGDVNGNGQIDLVDFSFFAGAYGTSTGHPQFNPNTDFNGDGLISLLDFSLLALNYGATVG